MALRLIEVIVPDASRGAIETALDEGTTLARWSRELHEERVQLSALVEGSQAENVLQRLEARVENISDARIVLLPVEAAIPHPAHEEDEEEDGEDGQRDEEDEGGPRISTAELHAEIHDLADLTPVMLALVLLSTIVAAFGLLQDNVVVVVGAMVIAPLLGPNVALSLATTLADPKMAKRATAAGVASLLVSIGAAVAMGLVLPVDPTVDQIASRTGIGLADLALALAAGAAGVLSFTVGISAALIGVMVAVALLPPVVAMGLLAGSGYTDLALGAGLLAAGNVICVNLAGVITFLIQGVRPRQWWEAERAKRATATAIVLWLLLLGLLVLVLWRSPGFQL